MTEPRKILFLQLPQIDNDIRGPRENVPLAAAYLRHAIRLSADDAGVQCQLGGDEVNNGDDARLLHAIVSARPDVVACTLYLWNIERTLAILEKVRPLLPKAFMVAGGPEVAPRHPFLFRSRILDAAATGEGEGAFPAILQASRTGRRANLNTVAERGRAGYRWGTQPPPVLPLRRCVPSVRSPAAQPDGNGMAYLECSRGCPRLCSYCRYHHSRRGLSALPPGVVLRRIRALAARGATEIRFVDPTFSAHPAFEEILAGIARANRRHALRFFAELNAESITPDRARLLARAGFREIEVGVQSTDPAVLRNVRRPTRIPALESGIRAMMDNGIKVTVDLMYGLPGQTFEAFRRDVRWALRLRGSDLQCLQTLLLPGTDLRAARRRWGIRCADVPPYGVISTSAMPPDDLARAESFLQAETGLSHDVLTSRFVGAVLPDLFPEQVRLQLPRDVALIDSDIPGAQNRRAVLIHGPNLWSDVRAITRLIRNAGRSEPHILWQFVLVPEREEPLDLLDAMIGEVRKMPSHINDRYASARLSGRRSARRVMVKLRRGAAFDRSWVAEAERILSGAFQ